MTVTEVLYDVLWAAADVAPAILLGFWFAYFALRAWRGLPLWNWNDVKSTVKWMCQLIGLTALIGIGPYVLRRMGWSDGRMLLVHGTGLVIIMGLIWYREGSDALKTFVWRAPKDRR